MGGIVAGSAALGAGGSLGLLAPGTRAQAATTASRKGGNFIEASPVQVKTVNPIFFSGEEGGDWLGHMMFAGLMTGNASGEIQPLLAAAPPTISEDQLTITFKLRSDAKWTDGQPLTADDVVFTYKIHSDPAYAKTNTGQRLAGRFSSISAPDPHTVVFTLSAVWPAFLLSNAHYGIIPKHVLGSLSAEDLNTTPFNQNPAVTSGAFKMGSFKPGEQVSLQRNPASFLGGSILNHYTLLQLSGTTGIVNGLLSGEVHLGPLDPSLLSSVQSNPSLAVYSYVSNGMDLMYYQMDPSQPGSQIFADHAVRQALLYALDRKKMVKAIYYNQAVVADSQLPRASWAYTSKGLPHYGFDKAKAQSLLEGAGWKMGSSGVRQKNGKDLRFEILSVSGQAPYPDMIASMADQWKAVGAAATTRLLESDSVVDVMINKRNFDLLLFPLTLGADPDLTPLWSSKATAQGAYNASHYVNPQLDKLITDAGATNNINRRKQLYAECQKVLMTDLPAAVLFYPKALWGINKHVQGVRGVLGAYNKYQRAWMRKVNDTSGA